MPGQANTAPAPVQLDIKAIASVASIFQESQTNTSVHRKNANSLKKVLLKTPAEQFNQEFAKMLNKVISIKKKEPAVERLIKFVIFFVKYIQEKDGKDDTPNAESSLAAFVDFLLRYLLQGVESKDKAVRFRACHLIAMIMDSIEEVDDNLWQSIKDKLVQRLQDKEPAIRTQAVYALARLQGSEEPEEAPEDPSLPSDPIVAKFVQLLQQDTSADVRKAVLFNIEISEETLPYIIERARDADASIRKHVFKKSMEDIDFAALSIETRETLLKSGLRDRDPAVRKTCVQMVCENWLKKLDSNLLVFITRLDAVGNTEVAEEVLKAIFEASPNLPFKFDDAYWENLTPDSVVLMRAFCEHAAQKKDDFSIDELLPEISKFCFYVRKYYDQMSEAKDDEEKDSLEFITEQLLLLSKVFDFSDEVGRRAMFTMLRDLFAAVDLPEGFVSKMVDVMYQISQDEAEFTRVMTEIISDVRMPIEASEKPAQREKDSATERQKQVALAKMKVSLQELRDEKEKATRKEDYTQAAVLKKKIQETEAEVERLMNQSAEETPELLELTMVSNESEAVILKSLVIAECLLKRTNDSLAQNPILCGLLRDLVLANIRHDNADIQFAVLRCLGLCCILDKNLAKQNIGLFLECLKEEQGDVKVILQTVFDVGVTFGMQHFNKEDNSPNELVVSALPFLHHHDLEIQAVAVEGFTKWLLLRATDNTDVLTDLIVLYFTASTQENPRAAQCLAYFVQAHSFSSSANQLAMAKVFLSCLREISDLQKEEQIVPLLQVAQQFVEWTDSSLLVKKESPADNAHVQVAFEILLNGLNEQAAVTKVLSQMLGKLRIPKSTTQENCKKLQILGEKFAKSVGDKVAAASVAKFVSTVSSLDSSPDRQLNEDEQARLLNQMVSKNGAENSDDEGADEETAAASKKGTTRSRKAPGGRKRYQVEESDEEDVDQEEDFDREDDS